MFEVTPRGFDIGHARLPLMSFLRAARLMIELGVDIRPEFCLFGVLAPGGYRPLLPTPRLPPWQQFTHCDCRHDGEFDVSTAGNFA